MTYVCALWTFSSAFLAPLALFTGSLAIHWGLVSRHHAMVVAIGASIGFAVVYLAFLAVGFDLWTCFQRAREINTSMMGSAWRSITHYLLSATGSLGGFAIGCGVPVVASWLAALRHYKLDRSAASCVAWSASATILLLALMGAYQWEVERIWLFFVPLTCVPAARYLYDITGRDARRIAPVLAVLWLQGVLMELMLDTYW